MNEENDAVGLLHADFVVQGSVNCLLIAATLSVKNEAKVSAVRLVAGGGGGGLSRVLKVEKSVSSTMNLVDVERFFCISNTGCE